MTPQQDRAIFALGLARVFYPDDRGMPFMYEETENGLIAWLPQHDYARRSALLSSVNITTREVTS